MRIRRLQVAPILTISQPQLSKFFFISFTSDQAVAGHVIRPPRRPHLTRMHANPLPPSRGSCSKAQQLRRHLKTAAPAPAPATSPPLKTPPSRRGRRPHLDVATPPPLRHGCHPRLHPATQRLPRRGRLVTTPTTASTASSRPRSLPQPPQRRRRRRHLDSANPAPPQHNAIPTCHHLVCAATHLGDVNQHPGPTSTGTRRRHVHWRRLDSAATATSAPLR
ncbi:hypothetical protein EDB84DRAFT_1583888 [Lactarius hengduanensis]|nr:hypothetical protein EDB84DRAFT_1583888 [Lactarius hengduanensis]